jgi:flagellar basal body-associated protein FliL
MNKIIALLTLVIAFNILSIPTWAADDSAPAKADSKADDKKDAKKGGEGGEKKPEDVSGGRFAGDPVYVHLAPILLPVISDAGVEQLVTIQIDIEVKDFDVADTVHSIMPRVMDALMTSLYGGLGQGSLRNGKLVDISKVKAKATAALQGVVGADGIKNVLIQGVAQRML